MKISAIGSCLSECILLKIDIIKNRKIKINPFIRHLRSDVLLDLLEGRLEGKFLSKDSLKVLVENNLGAQNTKNNDRILMQSQERLSLVKKNIEDSDVILLDPNYDLSRETMKFKNGESWSMPYILDRSGVIRDKSRVKFEKLMDITDTISNYKRIVDLIRTINPAARIFFINYPITGFKNNDYKNRVARQSFLAENFNSNNIQIVPLIDADQSSLSEKGPLYFNESFYSLIAQYIVDVLENKVDNLNPNQIYTELELRHYLNPNLKEKDKIQFKHPYSSLPDKNFWKKAIAEKDYLYLEDLYEKKFTISKKDKIATCGSCFAQHIGTALKDNGFNFFATEKPRKDMSEKQAKANGYNIYSARYGNIYTTRQLEELFDQSFDDNYYLDEVWEEGGRFFDPFRPNLFKNGFPATDTVKSARFMHLKNVRKMFENLDVFIFTLGLTETWINSEKDYAYPVCPGTTVGRFKPDLHKFQNLSFGETLTYFENFYKKLMKVNKKAKILLTVSPVPLTATYEKTNVLLATTESKSILRAVAGELYKKYPNIDYFPSYEIITSHPFKGDFYKENLRLVRPEGVNFVMSHFFNQHGLKNIVEQSKNNDLLNEEFCDESYLELQARG